MNKEELAEEFFRSLRSTLTNSFSYPKNHPYFIKSVEQFKLKLEELLAVWNPFKIGVTISGIVVEGMILARVDLYTELAQLLHRRKIKSIEIKNGVTFNELVNFFSVISLPQDEITKGGGINVLLSRQPQHNFTIEELDYSTLLHADGQECSDVWSYMFKDAVQSNDETKISNLADNFGTLIKGASQDDIFQAQETPAMIKDFLASLKNKDQEKFAKCSKDIFLWLLNNKKSIDEEKLLKLKQVFESLNPDDLSVLLWEGLSQEDSFDALSLHLFSKIAEQKNSTEIVRGTISKINAAQGLKSNPRVVKRIQNLLAGSEVDNLSAVYRNTLESLVKGISFSGELLFDQQALRSNYRYIVLNILSADEDQDNLLLAAGILEQELPSILEENDFNFLKDLRSLLIKRKKEGNGVCIDLEKKLSTFIENIVLNQSLLPEQEFFLYFISSPSQEAGFYLHKIFSGEKTNQYVLKLFFKFFPGNLDIFYKKVEEKLQDIDFIFDLVEALGQLTAPVTKGILDYIYSSVNEIIKVQILNIMRKLKKVDVEFLMRQLNTDSPSLRKNLLSVLMLDSQAKDGALDLLFKIPSFFGGKNELLMENLQIVSDLGFKEATSWVNELSRRRFFWNRKLRDKAKQILKEWNVK
ncbi:MAG: hypothetical protein NT014_03510 [Candidatus Omnitrophica bacterium]|nr:hypothetical protein [Candidatus Omnitrophota bacterium]